MPMFVTWSHLKNGILALVGMTIAANAYATGTKVGNGDGGDAVYCEADKSAGSKVPISGFYALDYLGTLGLDFGEPASVSSWRESAARIQNILNRVANDLATSFQEYVRDIKNTTDYTRRFTWEKAPYGLIKIDDQNIVALVPENCQKNKTVDLIPAAVHQNDLVSGRPPGKQLYLFVPSVLDSLEQTSALQISFLYVHEWLWNHSSNVGRNRRIGRFLHSASTDNLSNEELREQLMGMGLSLENQTPHPTNPSIPNPRPNPEPQPQSRPSDPSEYQAPESFEFQDRLFASESFCSSRANSGNLNTAVDFRLYSQYRKVGNDGVSYGKTYMPLLFLGDANKTAMMSYRLTPTYKIDGDMVELSLDAGAGQFHCIGSRRDGDSPVKMECELLIDKFTASWPKSTTWVKFMGSLYPGCFLAKAMSQPLYHDHFGIIVTGQQ